jgi:hypothetical protein
VTWITWAPSSGGLLDALAVARIQRDPQIPDLAGAHLLLQRLPQPRRGELLGIAAVGLQDVDVVGAQRPQRGVELFDDVPGRPVVASHRPRIPARPADPVGVKAMAELRRHDPLLAIAGDRAPDQRFGEMVAVALGRIDQVHAQLAGAADQRVDLALRERLAPFPAQLPRAQPDTETSSPVAPNRRWRITLSLDRQPGCTAHAREHADTLAGPICA